MNIDEIVNTLNLLLETKYKGTVTTIYGEEYVNITIEFDSPVIESKHPQNLLYPIIEQSKFFGLEVVNGKLRMHLGFTAKVPLTLV